MATRIEFLTNLQAKARVEKQDSGWIQHPEEPRLLFYVAYNNGDTLNAVLYQDNHQNYTYFTLSLVSQSARTVELLFSTFEDAKLAHKMMLDEEKRYATWEAQNPPKSVDLGTVTIRSLEDLKTLINRIATITNPAPNLQNTPKLFTGDPPKDKN